MSTDQKTMQHVVCVVKEEGFDYAFHSYSNFESVENKEFHELRGAYLEYRERLQDYVNKFAGDNVSEKDEINDLSYSGVTSAIQGDKNTAAYILDILARQLALCRENIAIFEKDLNAVKAEEQSIINACGHIVGHMKYRLPLIVQRSGYVIILNKDNLVIEENVI